MTYLTRGGLHRAINVPLAKLITGQLRLPAATRMPRSVPVTTVCGHPSKLVLPHCAAKSYSRYAARFGKARVTAAVRLETCSLS
jgi:hypothetical protein